MISGEHEHGPSCGHVAVHHISKTGDSHIGFVNEDVKLDCFEVQPSEKTEGEACSMKLVKCELEECFIEDLGDSDKKVVGCEKEVIIAEAKNLALSVDNCHGYIRVSQKEGKVADTYFNAHGLSHLCDLKQDPSAQGFTVKSDNMGTIHVPSVCSGMWDMLFHSANCGSTVVPTSVYFNTLLATRKKSAKAVTTMRVNNMCCAMEAKMLERCLKSFPGVISFQVSVPLKQVKVVHDKVVASTVILNREIGKLKLNSEIISTTASESHGYGTFSEGSQTAEHVDGPDSEMFKIKFPDWNLSLALLLLLISLIQYVEDLAWLKYVALGSIGLCLPSVADKSWSRVTQGILDITTLMSLACIGAVALGDYTEGAAVITLYSFSDWLEMIASTRVRNAIHDLINLKPVQARLIDSDGKIKVVPVEQLFIGDVVQVRDGDSVPVDGTLLTVKSTSNEIYLDESAFTGEPKPVRKLINDAVLAGSLNVGGAPIHVTVTSASDETVVSKMLKLVAAAQENKSDTEQFVEKVAGVYTPAIFFCSLMLATVGWFWGVETGKLLAKYALVLLVVGCPCALVISTPIVYVSGLAEAGRSGILVKGGKYLETLARLKLIAFDKTGTLTKGHFSLISYKVLNQIPESFVRNVVAKIEESSSHPIALSLQKLKLADDIDFAVDGVETIPGKGLQARICKKVTYAEDTSKTESNKTRKLWILSSPIDISNQVLKDLSTIQGVVSVDTVVTGQIRVVSSMALDSEILTKGTGLTLVRERILSSGCEEGCCVDRLDKTAQISPPAVNAGADECTDGCCAPKPEPPPDACTNGCCAMEEPELLEPACSKGCCDTPSASSVTKWNSSVQLNVKILEKVTNEDIKMVAKIFEKANVEVEASQFVTLDDDRCVITAFSEAVTLDLDGVKKFLETAFIDLGIDVEIMDMELCHEVFLGSPSMGLGLGWKFSDRDQVEIKEMEKKGLTVICFGFIHTPLAYFGIGDEVKRNASKVLADLDKMNIRTMMLTGDNLGSANVVGSSIGMSSSQVKAQLKPEDKQVELLKVKQERPKQMVGFCGDGINDALSLATADVSLAMGEHGTSLAVETADIAILDDNLEKVVAAVKIGRLCLSKIQQNVIFSIGVKIVVILVTFLVPYPSLWLAIGSDVGAMLLVTINGISVLSSRPTPAPSNIVQP